jgi:hypothetical protein
MPCQELSGIAVEGTLHILSGSVSHRSRGLANLSLFVVVMIFVMALLEIGPNWQRNHISAGAFVMPQHEQSIFARADLRSMARWRSAPIAWLSKGQKRSGKLSVYFNLFPIQGNAGCAQSAGCLHQNKFA